MITIPNRDFDLVIEQLTKLLEVNETSVAEVERNLMIAEDALNPLVTQNSQITRQAQRVLATTARIAVRQALRAVEDLKGAVQEGDRPARTLQ